MLYQLSYAGERPVKTGGKPVKTGKCTRSGDRTHNLQLRRLTPYPLGYTGMVLRTEVTFEECHQTLDALSEDRTQDLLLTKQVLYH